MPLYELSVSEPLLLLGRPECPLCVLVELTVDDQPDEPDEPDERDEREPVDMVLPEESESLSESERDGISFRGLTACLYAA